MYGVNKSFKKMRVSTKNHHSDASVKNIVVRLGHVNNELSVSKCIGRVAVLSQLQLSKVSQLLRKALYEYLGGEQQCDDSVQ